MKNNWDIWATNFYNAKRFFESKGNIHTKSKHKDRWCKEFHRDIQNLLAQQRKQFEKIVGEDIKPDPEFYISIEGIEWQNGYNQSKQEIRDILNQLKE